MSNVVPLRITHVRQDDLAHEINLQRLARINQRAAWRKEILGLIAEAENTIAELEGDIKANRRTIRLGHSLLKKLDGGPNDAA